MFEQLECQKTAAFLIDHANKGAFAKFPTVPESIIDPAEFRGSASEARSHLHTYTRSQGTATHKEHP